MKTDSITKNVNIIKCNFQSPGKTFSLKKSITLKGLKGSLLPRQT